MPEATQKNAEGGAPATDQGVPRWEHFDHDADIGVRGVGATEEEAFAQAALALTGVVTDPERVRQTRFVEIDCEAPDDEVLLVDWLNALVTEMACRGMLFGAFEVHIEHGRLRAVAHGEPVDESRHEPGVEIKGATFTALKVGRENANGPWIVQCVVDV